jgi:hypothetical protein
VFIYVICWQEPFKSGAAAAILELLTSAAKKRCPKTIHHVWSGGTPSWENSSSDSSATYSPFPPVFEKEANH